MFRLLKSGLPKDPVYPAELKGLGYFINEEDEVRMIANPRAYFKYFLTKNDRYNDVQREAMNRCLREEIVQRIHNLGLETVRLPLGAREADPHIPILVSSDILEKKRVVILFYEHTQDLGVFAYRIVGGRGGINAGSAVNFIKYIQSLGSSNGKDSPGIILANVGQLRWWRRGKKAVTHATWFSLPQKSAVSGAYRFDLTKNTVPGNRSIAEHISYVFNIVVPELLRPDAILEVISVSVAAVEVVDFLNKPQNWAILQPRMAALALIATYHRRDSIDNPWFADWLRKRGRAYILSAQPAATPLAPPEGNSVTDTDNNTTTTSDSYGCPVYSLGEPYCNELMLPKGYKYVLDWFQEVAASGEEYENPEVVIEKSGDDEVEADEGEVEKEELRNSDVNGGELLNEESVQDECKVAESRIDRAQVETTHCEKIKDGDSKDQLAEYDNLAQPKELKTAEKSSEFEATGIDDADQKVNGETKQEPAIMLADADSFPQKSDSTANFAF